MKLPKKIDVCGFYYDVLFPYLFDDDPDLVGLHSSYDMSIKVADSFGSIVRHQQQICETLLHEVFHAIDYWCLGEVLSEEEVTELSRGWFSVICCNSIKLDRDDYIPKSVNIRGLKYVVKKVKKFDDDKLKSASVNFYNQTIFLSDEDCCPLFKKIAFISTINAILIDGNVALESIYEKINIKVFSHVTYSVLKKNKLEEVIRRAE